MVTWIILSRSRALQLDALLRSMKANISAVQRCILLYKCDSERHRNAYGDLIDRHRRLLASVIEEQDFATDLREIINQVSTPLVGLLVDDIVFVNNTPLHLLPYVKATGVPLSLRLGKRITKCQPLSIDTPAPSSFSALHKNSRLMIFPWMEGQGDWGVRYSLDGNIVCTSDIQKILEERTTIHGPQTLEIVLNSHSLCKDRPYGLCFTEPRAINLAVNRVSTETIDYPSGTSDSAEELLCAYEKGLQINIEQMSRIYPNACHIILDLKLEQRAH
jgi:hypothetical protein